MKVFLSRFLSALSGKKTIQTPPEKCDENQNPENSSPTDKYTSLSSWPILMNLIREATSISDEQRAIWNEWFDSKDSDQSQKQRLRQLSRKFPADNQTPLWLEKLFIAFHICPFAGVIDIWQKTSEEENKVVLICRSAQYLPDLEVQQLSQTALDYISRLTLCCVDLLQEMLDRRINDQLLVRFHAFRLDRVIVNILLLHGKITVELEEKVFSVLSLDTNIESSGEIIKLGGYDQCMRMAGFPEYLKTRLENRVRAEIEREVASNEFQPFNSILWPWINIVRNRCKSNKPELIPGQIDWFVDLVIKTDKALPFFDIEATMQIWQRKMAFDQNIFIKAMFARRPERFGINHLINASDSKAKEIAEEMLKACQPEDVMAIDFLQNLLRQVEENKKEAGKKVAEEKKRMDDSAKKLEADNVIVKQMLKV